MVKGNGYTLKVVNSIKIVLAPSEKDLLIQERICSLWGPNSFLLEYTSFQKGLGVQEWKQAEELLKKERIGDQILFF